MLQMSAESFCRGGYLITENVMDEKVLLLKEKIDQADAVIIGAGAGLSTLVHIALL